MGVIVLDAGNGFAAGFDTFFTGDFAALFWTLLAFADVDFAGLDLFDVAMVAIESSMPAFGKDFEISELTDVRL